MIKHFFLCLVFLPVFASAQQKKKKSINTDPPITASSEGYKINGLTEGFPDGTVVDFLNGNNRAPEATTVVSKGNFSFDGKMSTPDFKLITFDKSQAFIVLFLDNSNVEIKVKKDELDRAIVSGSKSHDDFIKYSQITKPYESMFQPNAVIDNGEAQKCIYDLINFVMNNKSSFIAPLAIYRINQLSNDGVMMEQLYTGLTLDVQNSNIGAYIGQQIAELKKDPMGKVIPDFEQADENGKMINIKSFRGKYVLIDFWASWCGPCRGENPNVVSAFNKYKNKGFTVLGVSLDKSKEPWIQAINQDQLTWTHVCDLRGWSNSADQKFGITSIPQNFLIDPAGIVIGKNLRGEALEAKLASIFK